MTPRIAFVVTAVLGVAGVVLASASGASAQLPPIFDFAAFLTQLFQSLSSVFSFLGLGTGFLSDLFGSLLEGFTGSCAPFCAS